MIKTKSATGLPNYILFEDDLNFDLDKDLTLVTIEDFRENIVSFKQLKYANSVSFFYNGKYNRLG